MLQICVKDLHLILCCIYTCLYSVVSTVGDDSYGLHPKLIYRIAGVFRRGLFFTVDFFLRGSVIVRHYLHVHVHVCRL